MSDIAQEEGNRKDRVPSRSWPPVWLSTEPVTATVEITVEQPVEPVIEAPPSPPRTSSTQRCRRCPSTEYVDVAIHNGQSIRRDCARCGYLWDFPVWYG